MPLPEANKVYDTKTVKNTPEDKTVLHEAGYIVNDLIHNEIDKQSMSTKSDDVSLFCIHTQLKNVLIHYYLNLWNLLQQFVNVNIPV